MTSHSGSPDPSDTRVPVEQVLKGLELHPLGPQETVLEAFVLIKLLDENGRVGWSYRTTHQLNREELLGALMVQTDVLRKELRDEWDE
jgi:hypothetical protein